VNAVATHLSAVFDPEANIIFGATVDEAYGDELTVA
jgi:cell division GTPase FtsZ